jgi:hypothetical protein
MYFLMDLYFSTCLLGSMLKYFCFKCKCNCNNVFSLFFCFSYSKALWVTISGTNTNASEDVVSHELERAHDQLQNGLNHFKDPSKESESEFKTQVSDAVFKFTMRLKRFLVSYVHLVCGYIFTVWYSQFHLHFI